MSICFQFLLCGANCLLRLSSVNCSLVFWFDGSLSSSLPPLRSRHLCLFLGAFQLSIRFK
jgi:hypothetical protein